MSLSLAMQLTSKCKVTCSIDFSLLSLLFILPFHWRIPYLPNSFYFLLLKKYLFKGWLLFIRFLPSVKGFDNCYRGIVGSNIKKFSIFSWLNQKDQSPFDCSLDLFAHDFPLKYIYRAWSSLKTEEGKGNIYLLSFLNWAWRKFGSIFD